MLAIPQLCQGVDITEGFIEGNIGFTNTNPIVTNTTMNSCSIRGFSTTPSGLSASTNCNTFSSPPLMGKYNLTVESAGGVTYGLSSHTNLSYPGSASGRYDFATQNGIFVPPPTAPTAPSTVSKNITECAGIIDFNITSCPGIKQLSLNYPRATKDITNPGLQTYFIVPEDNSFSSPPTTRKLTYTLLTGSDPFSDTFRISDNIAVSPISCDMETKVTISPVCGGVIELFGKIEGEWDIVGSSEIEVPFRDQLTRIFADRGPHGNSRLDHIATNGPWELVNLLPGNYRVGGVSLLDRVPGNTRAFNYVSPESLGDPGQIVVANTTTALGNTFVMDPAFIYGDILLNFPTIIQSPALFSGLDHLRFNDDKGLNSSGVLNQPNFVGINGSFVGAVADNGSRLGFGQRRSCFAQAGYGCSRTAWPFNESGMSDFDPTQGFLQSNYEMVAVNANNVVRPWQAQHLHLVIQNSADPVNYPNNPSSLTSPSLSELTITDKLARTSNLGPAGTLNQDFKYCFGQVNIVNYNSAGSIPFHGLKATVNGGFSGTNFLGQNVDYDVQGTFFGTPSVATESNITGAIQLTLPEGENYIVTPTVKTGASTTQFIRNPVKSLGCGEVKTLPPGLDVSLNPPLPNCAPKDGQVDMNVIVTTEDDGPINRVYYTVNDGPEIDICSSDCGDDAEFTTSVSVEKGRNNIAVFAILPVGPASIINHIEFDTPRCNIKTASCDADAPGAIIGTEGNDTLLGTPGDDVIIGLGGNDTIFGYGGNDCIDGGQGNDKILGGFGDDTIIGGSGDDQIFNDRGNDTTNSGPGNDRILGGAGNDLIGGGSGNDDINGNGGDDDIFGDSGDDFIKGSSGNDMLDGGFDIDKIHGGPGTDTCTGGESVSQCE
jgi:hypothetical protein